LGVGQRQRVEILKALYRGADLLILDEPTAVLTPQEADHLFQILRALRAQGKTVLLITHKLREIREATDVVTVMRQGRVVAALPAPEPPRGAPGGGGGARGGGRPRRGGRERRELRRAPRRDRGRGGRGRQRPV